MNRSNQSPRCVAVAMAVFILWTYGSSVPALTPELGMTDVDISEKIEQELRHDDAVNASRVQVISMDGIVELRGEVNNLLAQERAGRIAEAVRGVRSVVNRIKVLPETSVPDEELTADIQSALRGDAATDSYDVKVDVVGGVVHLGGSVASHQQRLLAVNVVKGVRGVIALDNQIEVRPTTERSASEIQQEIERALSNNVYIDDNLIEVHVDDGVVVLSGTVGSAAEWRTAVETAWVSGVTDVDGASLMVASWTRDPELRGEKFAYKPDTEILYAIQDSLRLDPRVNVLRVDVMVRNGHVTLRGEVDSLKAKRSAAQVASRTVGVLSVDNRLQVEASDEIGDTELVQRVREAWNRNPYLSEAMLAVQVNDGVAELSGVVSSPFGRRQADDVASRVSGIVRVENRIKVDDTYPSVYDPYVDRDLLPPPGSPRSMPPLPDRSDVEIKEDIEDELWWSPFVNADLINVRVQGGVASLGGRVDSPAERQAAEKNAYDGGAISVRNNIEIRRR